MPALTAQDLYQSGQVDVVYTTLDGTDTFTYAGRDKELLLVRNTTGATINATLIGDEAPAEASCQGLGDMAVTPEALDVLDGEDASLYLNVIATKLAGVVTITGGTGLEVAHVKL